MAHTRFVTVLGGLVLFASPCLADGWSWAPTFTPASSRELAHLHEQLAGSVLGPDPGSRVADGRFKAPGLEIDLKSGAVWQEPPVEGYSAGAWFEGDAVLRFTPADRKSRSDMLKFFGREQLTDVPIAWAYFFTLRGTPLATQLGATADPAGPVRNLEAYSKAKSTLRQLGMGPLTAWLEREGVAKGSVLVLFAPEALRANGDSEAALLYGYAPSEWKVVQISVFGHRGAFLNPRARQFLAQNPDYRYSFWPIVSWRAPGPGRWIAPVEAERHRIDLDFTKTLSKTRESAEVTLMPSRPVQTVVFTLTSRLAVDQVLGAGGEPLPFAQWTFVDTMPDLDPTLVVHLPAPLEPGKPVTWKVTSSGPIFDPSTFASALAVEDIWYPYVFQTRGAHFETSGTTSKSQRFVASGEQLSDEVAGNLRTTRFATSRAVFGSSFYVGTYDTRTGKAGNTKVEINVDRGTGDSGGSAEAEYLTQEVTNAIEILGKILDAPLEVPVLRAVTTPTFHGRGFEGLLLLSSYGSLGYTLSRKDLFCAHEVAHQWWGNMVEPDDWREDRWLSESLAEYVAMEYYTLRFQKPSKTRELMRDAWERPLRMSSPDTIVNLVGEKRKVAPMEIDSLADGGQIVYSKGPLVLNQLRYLFTVFQKNDEGFWLLLQDLIKQHKYGRVSTRTFMDMVEQRFGGRMDWFWEQWFYGTAIPTVHWSYRIVEDAKGGYAVEVEGTQESTAFQMAIPIHVTLKDGRTVKTPLLFAGKTAKARLVAKEKPSRVELNEDFEALVWLTKS